MKKAVTLSALAVAGLAAGAGYFGLQDCGWLDKFLVRSGCVESIDIANLTSVFSSMEIDQEGRLVVAGVDYRALSGNVRNVATYPQIVTLDLESGREIERIDLDFQGLPDQLRLSPIDGHFALACNIIYSCNLADTPSSAEYVGAAQIGLFDPDGLVWSNAITRDKAQPSAEGRAFDLAFAADGTAIMAGPVAFAVADGTALDEVLTPVAPHSVTVDSPGAFQLAGNPRSLDLPTGYVPFNHLQTACRRTIHSSPRCHVAFLGRAEYAPLSISGMPPPELCCTAMTSPLI